MWGHEGASGCCCCACIKCFLCIAGAIAVCKSLVCLVSTVIRRYRAPCRLSDCGEWAVVTGATDGIGKAMTMELAAKYPTLNFLLISRSNEKLQATVQEVRSLHPACSGTLKTLAVDFSSADETIFRQLAEAVAALDVGILVNNVGLGYPFAQFFHELSAEFVDELINVNIRSTLRLTHLIYPGMVKRKRGAILCVGSGASELPSNPLYAGYVAVKAAVEGFCRSLQVESAEFNVLVQCHVPLLVTTKMSKCKKASWTVPDASTYARLAIGSLERGRASDVSSVSPYWVHAAMVPLAWALPAAVYKSLRLNECRVIRAKALKKIEAAAKEN
eukprot:GHVT01090924.1.p1 GENE.GHVT01090924.1~~GHVT01090924.1.p1  ORF type:complete len:361 (-),score=82.05 GHVT01090924.1:1021-2013(-)